MLLIFRYSAQILLENSLFCQQNARPPNRLFCSKFCRQNLSKPTTYLKVWIYHKYPPLNLCFTKEQFSIECCKTKIKVIILTNYNTQTAQWTNQNSKQMHVTGAKRDQVMISFSLDEKVARVC